MPADFPAGTSRPHRFRRYDEALACYHRALDLHAVVGDRHDETVVLTHIAETHCATGEAVLARTAWHRALNILTELGHPDAEAVRGALRAGSSER